MSDTERKTLLVVEHGVTLGGAAYKKLSDAGFIVVRGDPSQFHVMESIPSGQSGVIAEAALATIRAAFSNASGHDVRSRFGRELLDRLGATPIPFEIKP